MDNNTVLNILENQEIGIIILNTDKQVEYSNKTIKNLFGDKLNEFLGDYINCEYTTIEKVHCQHTTRCSSCIINRTIDNVIKNKNPQIINSVKLTNDFTEINASLKISLSESNYVLLEFLNIDVENSETKLLSRLTDKSKDMMFFKNEKLSYLYVNKPYADLLTKEKDYILGKTDLDLVNENLLDSTLYEQCLVGDQMALEKGQYHDIEIMGDRYFRVSKENIDGGILGIARDITEEINAIKKSEVDFQTDLFNRSKFEEKINKIYSSKETNYYLALIDLDNLRDLNNNYGHLLGDKYLSILGRILKTQTIGTFFRIGGDEFAGLINCDENALKILFKNIYNEISNLKFNPKLSISVGINKLDLSEDFEKNYDNTDTILYKAKETGKNKFIINSK